MEAERLLVEEDVCIDINMVLLWINSGCKYQIAGSIAGLSASFSFQQSCSQTLSQRFQRNANVSGDTHL